MVRLPVSLLVGEVDLAVLQQGLAGGAEKERGVVAASRPWVADDRAAEDGQPGVAGGRREGVVAGAARGLGVGAGWLPGEGGPGVEGQLREDREVGARGRVAALRWWWRRGEGAEAGKTSVTRATVR